MKTLIDNYISSKREEIFKDIQSFISMPSFTGQREACHFALEYILNKAEGMGMNVFQTSTKDIGVIEIGQGKDVVGVLLNVDTVDIGDKDKWRHPPLVGKREDGYLYGRGVVDGKGPVIMLLYSLKALLELGLPLSKRIWLIVGTLGEGRCFDFANFKKEFPLPKFGFTPDGDFPIYNREKGYCNVELFFNEPNRHELESCFAGANVNTIPSKASIKLKGKPELIVHGVSCHGSTPTLGDNSILKIASDKTLTVNFNFIDFINDFLQNPYNGKKLGIDYPTQIYNEKEEETATVPTTLRLTDEGVHINLDLRLSFGVTEKHVYQAFEYYAKKYNYTFLIADFVKAMEVDENEEFLQTMAEVYCEYGFVPSFRMTLGSSLAKTMPQFVSWGPVLETELSCAHMENEKLSLNSIVVCTQMYACYLFRVAGSFNNLRKNQKAMTSVEKALALLEIFAEPPYMYDVVSLAETLGMNRTTTYRYLTALERSGFLQRTEGGKAYALGEASLKLHDAYHALKVQK